jgi:RNA recognition motif-containing protein
MSAKLHVGNLQTQTNSVTLTQAFQGGGRHVVSVEVVRSRDPKHSRGFAFVQMGTEEDAAAAVHALHGTEIDGRRVRVTIAHPPKSRFGGPY